MNERAHSGKAIIVSAVAALGGVLFGFDTAVINGAVDAIRSTFALSVGATGMAVACALGARQSARGSRPESPIASDAFV